MIDLRFLGPFSAQRRDGSLLHPPGRRSILLLTCLAVEERSWPRAELAALLWPGRSTEQARASLRQELLRLRGTLGEFLVPLSAQIGMMPPLDLKYLEVDVVRFRKSARDPSQALAAIELYRGHLLETFQWPEHRQATAWLEKARAQLRQDAIGCMHRLLASPNASESIARRLTELAPEVEEGHAWLIRHYARSGDDTRALEAFQTYVLVTRASGQEPSKAVQALLAPVLGAPPAKFVRPRVSETIDWIRSVRERSPHVNLPAPRLYDMVRDRPSLVVLPFLDLSPAQDGSVLAQGLTEELTTALAFIPGFFVTARHSAMVYKAVATDVRVVTAELGVRYAVEGSIEIYDGRMRVNVRLIDGETGLHLWADRQDIQVREIWEARDEIVRTVAARLQPSLLLREVQRALRRPTEELDAWEWMQRALGALLYQESRYEALRRALEALTRALELDPGYAMAHALLSTVYTMRTLSHASSDINVERTRARQHAERALRIEPDNSFVLVHCAETAIYCSAQLDEARRMLEEAINRNPNDAHCLASLGNVRRFIGEDDVVISLALIDQAMRLSPRDPRSYIWFHYRSWCYWKLGQLPNMEIASRRSVDLFAAYPHSWIALTCALGLQGKKAEAREAARGLRALHPDFSAAHFYGIAQRFYGHRFPGLVSAEYRQLCTVLSDAEAGVPPC